MYKAHVQVGANRLLVLTRARWMDSDDRFNLEAGGSNTPSFRLHRHCAQTSHHLSSCCGHLATEGTRTHIHTCSIKCSKFMQCMLQRRCKRLADIIMSHVCMCCYQHAQGSEAHTFLQADDLNRVAVIDPLWKVSNSCTCHQEVQVTAMSLYICTHTHEYTHRYT